MTMKEALFGWDGRLNRLQYLGYSMLSLLLAGLAAGVLIGIGSSGSTDANNGGQVVLAVILAIPVVVAYCWAAMAVTAKRLHDLGHPTIYLLWIWLINFGSGSFAASSPVLSDLLALIGLGISLYLLFAPGQKGDNQFGPQPD